MIPLKGMLPTNPTRFQEEFITTLSLEPVLLFCTDSVGRYLILLV